MTPSRGLREHNAVLCRVICFLKRKPKKPKLERTRFSVGADGPTRSRVTRGREYPHPMGIINALRQWFRQDESGNSTDSVTPPNDIHFLMAHRCLSEDTKSQPWHGMSLCMLCALLSATQLFAGIILMNSMGPF